MFEAGLGVVRKGVRGRSVAHGSKTTVIGVGARQVERKDREGGELEDVRIACTSYASLCCVTRCFSKCTLDVSRFSFASSWFAPLSSPRESLLVEFWTVLCWPCVSGPVVLGNRALPQLNS